MDYSSTILKNYNLKTSYISGTGWKYFSFAHLNYIDALLKPMTYIVTRTVMPNLTRRVTYKYSEVALSTWLEAGQPVSIKLANIQQFISNLYIGKTDFTLSVPDPSVAYQP